MAIPLLIRYEAQLARTGRARCKICGLFVPKGTHILKILGFRVNQSVHPECVASLALSLRDVLLDMKDDRDYVLRAFDGVIKVGFYAKTEDPKKMRFTTLKVVRIKPISEPKFGSGPSFKSGPKKGTEK